MNNASVIRQYELFYEANGDYTVPPSLAHEVAQDAVARVSRYTGAIALGSPQAFTMKSRAGVIYPGNLTLPGAGTHNIFLTGRRIAHPDIRQQAFYPRGIFMCDTNDIFVSTSAYLGSAASKEELSSATVHELGHSFELGHCLQKHCIMLARLTSRELEIFADIDEPFCVDHAEQLAVSGAATAAINHLANSIVFSNPGEHNSIYK